MKLIWHLIKKDAARDRWALLLWAFLFVGQVGLGVVARHPGQLDFDRTIFLQPANMVLVILQAVVGYILVARLVQADPLIGTTAFWRTRPISPQRLLIAKASGALLLFGLLPLLLLLPWWLSCGFGWRDVFWTGVETLGWQLLLIAPAFLIGALTDDLGRLLLWSLVLWLGLLAGSVVMQMVYAQTQGGLRVQGGFKGSPGGILYSRVWVSCLVMVLGAGGIVAHHYLTRHFVRSVVLVVCWLGVIAGVGRGWGVDWSGAIAALSERRAEPVPGLSDALALQLESASGQLIPPPRKGLIPREEARLQVLLRTSGVPDDLRPAVEWASQSWHWSDGVKLERNGSGFHEGESAWVAILRRQYALPTPAADEETRRWFERKQEDNDERMRRSGMRVYPRLSLPDNRQGLLIYRSSVPNSLFAKMQAEPPAYQADLRCVLYRPEVIAELPVQQESRGSGSGETYHYRRLQNRDSLVMTHPTLAISGLWFSAFISDRAAGSRWRHRSIMQINRVTGDVTWGWEGQSRGTAQMVIAGVSVYWSQFELEAPKAIRNGKSVVADPQWREHTFLAVVVEREAGRMDRQLRVDKFVVTPWAAKPTP